MKAFSIAWKDMQILFKNRGDLIYLVLLPLLFIVVMGGVFGAIDEAETDKRIPLAIVNLDSGPAAQTFIDALEAAGGVRVDLYEQSEALFLLDEKQVPRVLTIPANFSADMTANRSVSLRLVSQPDASQQETEAMRLVIAGVANDMALERQILASLQQVGDMMAASPQEMQLAFSVERMQDQAKSQFNQAQGQPLVSVVQTVPAQEGDREENPELDDVVVPGLAVMFMFLTAQNTARSIYDEKKVGSFRRLLAAPMSRMTLLAGKVLPNIFTGLLQAVVIFGFGVFGLRLLGQKPILLGNDLLAFVLVVLLIALCSSALGVLIAALARTESQIGGLSSFLLWGLAFLGGSMIPLFLLERSFGLALRVIPHYWANRAMEDLMIRGLALTDVVPEIAALLGFTALFIIIGLWRFDFD